MKPTLKTSKSGSVLMIVNYIIFSSVGGKLVTYVVERYTQNRSDRTKSTFIHLN